MWRAISAIVVLMLCSLAARPSAAAETLQLSVDGQPRSYLLARPDARTPAPTVIMLHGVNGTGERVAQLTGLDRLAPQQGFAAVFPHSRANVWNRFLPGTELPGAIELFKKFGGPPNDFGFLKALVADLVRRGISDPARVYLAGQSNGGIMTLRMLCSEGGPFAGIGLITSSMTEAIGEDCAAANPLPFIVINGTADTTVPYRGGLVAAIDPRTPSTTSVWSTDRLVLHFRRLNKCAQPPESSLVSGRQKEKVELERWTNCVGGPVTAYRVNGGTHGSTLAALETGKLLLDFFRDIKRVPKS